mmetsp:Transcript_96837/g.273692  ORF Transcript_96837/g.273692 Transcript_96837/m.273692 type:complete len:229 (+) Transcript_96837:21-707(+)
MPLLAEKRPTSPTSPYVYSASAEIELKDLLQLVPRRGLSASTTSHAQAVVLWLDVDVHTQGGLDLEHIVVEIMQYIRRRRRQRTSRQVEILGLAQGGSGHRRRQGRGRGASSRPRRGVRGGGGSRPSASLSHCRGGLRLHLHLRQRHRINRRDPHLRLQRWRRHLAQRRRVRRAGLLAMGAEDLDVEPHNVVQPSTPAVVVLDFRYREQPQDLPEQLHALLIPGLIKP